MCLQNVIEYLPKKAGRKKLFHFYAFQVIKAISFLCVLDPNQYGSGGSSSSSRATVSTNSNYFTTTMNGFHFNGNSYNNNAGINCSHNNHNLNNLNMNYNQPIDQHHPLFQKCRVNSNTNISSSMNSGNIHESGRNIFGFNCNPSVSVGFGCSLGNQIRNQNNNNIPGPQQSNANSNNNNNQQWNSLWPTNSVSSSNNNWSKFLGDMLFVGLFFLS